MTIETVEKRDRRLVRERRKIADFRHALQFFTPYEALRHMRGMYATWDAVRRVAGALLGTPVKDVFLAWQIVKYVGDLPDGKKRLKAATDEALAWWEEELP